MAAIQLAQALITAFLFSNTTGSPLARPSKPADVAGSKVTTAYTDGPTLVSVYRDWYGSNHFIQRSFLRSQA